MILETQEATEIGSLPQFTALNKLAGSGACWGHARHFSGSPLNGRSAVQGDRLLEFVGASERTTLHAERALETHSEFLSGVQPPNDPRHQ